MPATANFNQAVTIGAGVNVRSVRYWGFANWADFVAAIYPPPGSDT